MKARTFVLIGTLAWGCGAPEKEAPPPEPVVEPEPPAPEPEPVAPPPPPPEPDLPRFGTLHVEGTAGAAVFLGGERLGTVPGRWEALKPGDHDLRVELENHIPFEVEVTIAAGRTRVVSAVLDERLGSIMVESDHAGAMVFLDRNFKGNTPVRIGELQPGEYRLTISLEGYDVENRRVTVERDSVTVRVEFGDPIPTLEAAVAVVHKHTFGSCAGTLAATEDGFAYRTDHRDAFTLAFGQAEAFELNYIENNLRLKVRGGRTYNFESPTDDMDSLFVFHRDVNGYREAVAAR